MGWAAETVKSTPNHDSWQNGWLAKESENETLQQYHSYKLFLGAPKHLYNWLCPSVGLSVTHSFDDPHCAPYWPTWPCFLAFSPVLSQRESTSFELLDVIRIAPPSSVDRRKLIQTWLRILGSMPDVGSSLRRNESIYQTAYIIYVHKKVSSSPPKHIV